MSEQHSESPSSQGFAKLMLGAIGVVYGDIGTSPLYAFREAFIGHHPLPIDAFHVYSVLSMMVWSLMMVVTVKYVLITLRADNKGEGGSFALLALLTRRLPTSRWLAPLTLFAVLATALFYGDAMLTPAVSVLGAMEGLYLVSPALGEWIVPLTVVITIALFLFQRHGTAVVGAFFGPITLVYFGVIAVLGGLEIAKAPAILSALNPLFALEYLVDDPMRAFFTLGSVVLTVTGAEALYADMGHFGRKPISSAWLLVVLPALLINYFGQGALVLASPKAIENPFFALAPAWGLIPLVLIATLAAIIASQAVISGAYSVTQQAIQLGFLPRMGIQYTSASASGQIYVPFVNWALMLSVIALVLTFRSSGALAAAYGLAVTGTMWITTVMIGVVMLKLWKWPIYWSAPLLAVMLIIDGGLFASSATKIPDGGWFPLVIGLILFTVLTTWRRGRQLLNARLADSAMPMDLFIKSAVASATRVPQTAVFLTSTPDGVPPALLHNIKHNGVLHAQNLLVTVETQSVPVVPLEKRLSVRDLGNGFARVALHYGFMEQPDIPAALQQTKDFGFALEPMKTSYFLNRQTLIPSKHPGMALWREHLFAWMVRNASSAMQFFRLPTNRVVELGSQLEI